jgi:hypothetical protein
MILLVPFVLVNALLAALAKLALGPASSLLVALGIFF